MLYAYCFSFWYQNPTVDIILQISPLALHDLNSLVEQLWASHCIYSVPPWLVVHAEFHRVDPFGWLYIIHWKYWVNGTDFKNHYMRTRSAVNEKAFEAFECLEILNHLWAMTTHGHADWTWAMHVSTSGESWCEQRLQQIPQGLDDQSAMFHDLLRELLRPQENWICLSDCWILVISRFCQPAPCKDHDCEARVAGHFCWDLDQDELDEDYILDISVGDGVAPWRKLESFGLLNWMGELHLVSEHVYGMFL